MTTPDKIATLTRIRVPLKTGEFDEREFHAMPSLLRFLEEILPGAKAGVLGATESPAAQMDTLLRKRNAGKPGVFQSQTHRPRRLGNENCGPPDFRMAVAS